MSYEDKKVIGIRKVGWDELWHVLYTSGFHITYDRVSREEALKVEGKMR